MKRKILSGLIAVCLGLFLCPLSALAASDFTDMPAGAYGEVLQKAVDNGLLVGDDQTIMPTAPLTRAQMAAIISRAFGAQEKENIGAFSDVSKEAWYYTSIQTACQMGAFKGEGTKFLPDNNITREEAFVVIARVLKLAPAESLKHSFADADQLSSWAKGLVYAMANSGYANGDGTNLRPKEMMTRQDFATVFDNIIKTYVRAADTVQTVAAGNVMINVPGVTLKDLTVTGDLIIGEGAGSGDVTLDHVTVTGRIVVRGGGKNSIHIKNNSQVGSLVISKTDSGAIRVATEAGCSVEYTYIDDGKDDVILEGAFEKVSVECNVPVVAQNAQIATVTVAAEAASLKVEGTSSIAAVEIKENAKGATLEVSKSAKVTKVESSAAGVSISGSGTVSTAVISGNNTEVNTSGTKMTVAEGTSGVSENGNSVAGGKETTTESSTSSGGSLGGGSSSYTASVATAAELQSALSTTRASAIRITASFTLAGDSATELTLSKPVTIDSGVTLTVGGNMKLSVGSTLTNNGTIVIAGEETSHTNNVVIGELVVRKGGTLTNSGIVTIGAAACDSGREDGGPNGGLLCVNGGTVNNHGIITAEQGSNSYWGGYLEVANASTFNNCSDGTVNFRGAILNIWADEGKALFNNSGILNVTYGTVRIGDNATLEVTEEGSLDNRAEISVGEYEYDDETETEYTSEARLLVSGSLENSGAIAIVQPGSNALGILGTGSVVNTGTIVNNGRINVMGALDTSVGTINNSHNAQFFVQYTEGVPDIVGKDKIGGMLFFAFDEPDLINALAREYTFIIMKADDANEGVVELLHDLTIPSGTKLLIDEGCSLQVPLTVKLTNNGEIYLALCERAEDEDDQLQAELYIAGTLDNTSTGTIQIADTYDENEPYSGGESVLWIETSGTVTNEGTITNYGRINVMGTLDTSDVDSAIANHGHFFVQYIEGVADIAGKENISGSAMMFLVFDEDGLTKALERNYTDIIVADEILLSKNLTIPSGTNLLILEECGLEVPLNVVLTNNGTVSNDGTVNISGGSYVNNGTWNGNEPVGGV